MAEILSRHLKSQKEASSSDVTGHFADVPKRTIERDLADLVKTKKLKVTGATRARRYS